LGDELLSKNGNVRFGAVAIGRNEGERLKQCLQSLSAAAVVVYVDSGSSDGSAQWARRQAAEVIDLDLTLPFTAARARNAGFLRLRRIAPDLSYVQFVDGDCELQQGWPKSALSFLEAHRDVGAVCGRRRERYPERSVYNWLCDREWDGPVGEVRACGGDLMMRIDALEAVGGYRADLIAGEEPELCVRLRATGWRIWRLDVEMTLHDAAMTRFGQWWRRSVRNGYAFAQGAHLHGAAPERHWVWESRRAWLWGIWLPVVCILVGFVFEPWGWAAFLIFPLQVLRQTARNPGPFAHRATLALFQVLARFPESWGQIKFVRDRLLSQRMRLIEYK
jgi:glycosyltransferase involved in cell wall biosynthesis